MKVMLSFIGKDSSLTLWGGYAVAFILIAGGGTAYMIVTVLAYLWRILL